jgi:amino acid transporter
VSIVLTIGTCALNMAGLSLATRTAAALAVFSFLPFAIAGLYCCATPLKSFDAASRVLVESSGAPAADLPLMLAVCLWSSSGFESVSFVSSEVAQSSRTMPRALALAIASMLIATILPIVTSCVELGLGGAGSTAAGGAASSTEAGLRVNGGGFGQWTLGSFALPADALGGWMLGAWTCAAGAASSVGLLNAFMLTSARNVQAMARRGLLPATLRGERGAEATPTHALLFSTVFILLLTPFGFVDLVEINMSLYAASLAMEQIALLRLRWREPELRRPFQIPLAGGWLVLLFVPQLALCLGIIGASLRSRWGLFLWLLVVSTGLALPRFGLRFFGKAEQADAGAGQLSRTQRLRGGDEPHHRGRFQRI